MTPHDLIANFELLAEAPDGIARLRELVLELAVRGKLVPQDPNDEPAYVLLERIAAQKARLVKEGKLPRSKALAPVSADEMSFKVPGGWVWARTQELTLMVTDGDHLPPPKSDSGIPFVVIGNISGGVIALTDTRYVSLDYYDSLNWTRKPMKGDLLYTVTGSFGIVVPVDTDIQFCVQRHIGILKTSNVIATGYLRLALSSPCLRDFAESIATGIAQKTVPLSGLRMMPVPLPPLHEQRRIVTKVDALMALLDCLEATRCERETARAALRDSTLAALRDAPDTEAVEAAWTRITERMDDLFVDPADVAPLWQTILQLAVRGKLVPQNPDDEPACILLERIAAEKVQLVKEGKISKPKLLPPVGEDEVPFEVPKTWVWCRFGSVLADIQAGWSPSSQSRPKEGNEWGVLKVSACSWGEFLPDENKALLPDSYPRPELEVREGDFLISRANTLELVARSVVVRRCPPRLMLSDKTLRLIISSFAHVDYLNLANLNDSTRQFYATQASGTSSSMRNVSQEAIRSAPIPLPPLPEQHRIVAKVDALMALCDALEIQLIATREAQAAFAAAAVHHLDV